MVDAFNLTNRVVLVTGAGFGLGRSFAYALAEQGATVICADIDVPTLDEIVQTIVSRGQLAHAVEVDVTDEGSVEAIDRARSLRHRAARRPRQQCGRGVDT